MLTLELLALIVSPPEFFPLLNIGWFLRRINHAMTAIPMTPAPM